MRLFGTLLSAALLAVVLASCNTTEALTPQANVGGGGARTSSPVTQAETDRMARSAQPETYNSSGGYQSGPQNTLEAQARALESGNTVSPSSSGPPPQWQGQGGGQDQQQTMQQPATAAAPPRQQSASLPPASGPTVRFLPIIGAPVQAVTPLSRQLGTQARANGLTIRPSSDSSTEHILKGYFSAFSDSGKVTIVYVWDILDGSGARLHRMQGQESVPGSGQDPWTSVPASTMETIAAKTIQEYVAWRQSQG
ncbi:hypothetical protein [Neorhizobium galegae]|uniref:hypothetical protein n=1 Tax=Neorhizobium galegae TaxID=399 RepID=UPI0006216BAB|nr:hypothetical protein [Neorhizobium galegae]KAB1124603.1 hypothetical protein F4V90_13495 [Neorhizobium galegae]MCQ1810457.1 hypothetical protein [Neorhizobium galegae]CDZ61239.1 Hypothetical protein NGAL_HAMBI2605_13950 [Neorhizobium galegae bv. orientalis]CDZ62967.1 Hypothetical protein NGAL_HAMBI2566_53300 [Neorhizobium galegae bv. orientalis]